tara:strand:+ start:119 stop:229 length:111 start_codon:yes stop_codon:yes gene_type:complete
MELVKKMVTKKVMISLRAPVYFELIAGGELFILPTG